MTLASLTTSVEGTARFFLAFTAGGVLLLVVGGLLWKLTHGEGLARSSGRGAAIAGVLLLVTCGLPALFFGVHGV